MHRARCALCCLSSRAIAARRRSQGEVSAAILIKKSGTRTHQRHEHDGPSSKCRRQAQLWRVLPTCALEIAYVLSLVEVRNGDGGHNANEDGHKRQIRETRLNAMNLTEDDGIQREEEV